MADVENVIYAIERCTCHVPGACRDCPYDAGHPYNECIEMLLKDAMELLKEQKGVPYVFDADGETVCGVCGCYFDKAYSNCPKCGKKVDWNV